MGSKLIQLFHKCTKESLLALCYSSIKNIMCMLTKSVEGEANGSCCREGSSFLLTMTSHKAVFKNKATHFRNELITPNKSLKGHGLRESPCVSLTM